MKDNEQIDDGIWKGKIDTSRIFNCDETPQFVNYGVDGTSTGLVYAGKGEACQKIYRENRECVTIQPFVSLAGDLAMFQVIFKSIGITSAMVPKEASENIQNLLISTAENGVLSCYQMDIPLEWIMMSYPTLNLGVLDSSSLLQTPQA